VGLAGQPGGHHPGRLEAELESGAGLSAAAVVADRRYLGMLAGAGLPACRSRAPPHGGGPGSAHAFFLGRSRSCSARPAAWSRAGLESAGPRCALAPSSASVPRLKGSALLVGETGLERGREAAGSSIESSTGTVSEDLAPTAQTALARIAKLLGTTRPAAAAKPASTSWSAGGTITAEPELWEAFSQESGELIGPRARVAGSGESSQPRQVLEKA
jgi:hypothetical protein